MCRRRFFLYSTVHVQEEILPSSTAQVLRKTFHLLLYMCRKKSFHLLCRERFLSTATVHVQEKFFHLLLHMYRGNNSTFFCTFAGRDIFLLLLGTLYSTKENLPSSTVHVQEEIPFYLYCTCTGRNPSTAHVRRKSFHLLLYTCRKKSFYLLLYMYRGNRSTFCAVYVQEEIPFYFYCT